MTAGALAGVLFCMSRLGTPPSTAFAHAWRDAFLARVEREESVMPSTFSKVLSSLAALDMGSQVMGEAFFSAILSASAKVGPSKDPLSVERSVAALRKLGLSDSADAFAKQLVAGSTESAHVHALNRFATPSEILAYSDVHMADFDANAMATFFGKLKDIKPNAPPLNEMEATVMRKACWRSAEFLPRFKPKTLVYILKGIARTKFRPSQSFIGIWCDAAAKNRTAWIPSVYATAFSAVAELSLDTELKTRLLRELAGACVGSLDAFSARELATIIKSMAATEFGPDIVGKEFYIAWAVAFRAKANTLSASELEGIVASLKVLGLGKEGMGLLFKDLNSPRGKVTRTKD